MGNKTRSPEPSLHYQPQCRGEFSLSSSARRICALPGDMLVTEEGQEERLFGE